MAVTEYIGSRYVPMFSKQPNSLWTDTITYEPLTIVLHNGNSYTSKRYVPVGIDISNTDYWAETGNYNAQVDAYRKEVQNFDSRITSNENNISAILPMDTIPTENSTKGVTSGGVYDSLKSEKISRENIGSFMPLNRLGRVFIQDYDIYNGSNTSIQAGCYVDGYYVFSVINTNNNSARIMKVNLESGYLAGYIDLKNAGHCNGACVNGDGNVVFLSAFNNDSTNNFTVSIINPNTMTLVSQSAISNLPNNDQVFAIGYDDGYYYALVYTGKTLYKLDNSFSYISSVSINMPKNLVISYNRNGCFVYSGYLYEIFNNSNTLLKFSIDDGSFVSSRNINEYQGNMFIGEIECGNVVDGNLYLISSVYANAYNYAAATFWYTPIEGGGYTQQFGPHAVRYNSDITFFVNQNSTEFAPVGTSDSPFKYVMEAVIAARACKNNKVLIQVKDTNSDVEEFLEINACNDIRLNCNGAKFKSIHIVDSNVVISTCNLTNYHDISPIVYPAYHKYTRLYCENSSVSFGFVNITGEKKNDSTYSDVFVDQNSRLMEYGLATSGYDPFSSSSNIVPYGDVFSLTNNGIISANMYIPSAISGVRVKSDTNITVNNPFVIENVKHFALITFTVPGFEYNKAQIFATVNQASYTSVVVPLAIARNVLGFVAITIESSGTTLTITPTGCTILGADGALKAGTMPDIFNAYASIY